jgi:ribosomal-protein-alanine N-acetyltransferase
VPLLATPALPAGTLANQQQPEIHANDLRLRPWQPDDHEAVMTAYADPAIRRWQAETGAGWAVVDGDKVAGQISLRLIDLQDGRAEVSYWVLPHARGRRTASRALLALTEWSFDTLGLHRIEVLHSTANEPSCRVAMAAGYGLEGTKRSEAKHADGWHDMHLHARIVGDR